MYYKFQKIIKLVLIGVFFLLFFFYSKETVLAKPPSGYTVGASNQSLILASVISPTPSAKPSPTPTNAPTPTPTIIMPPPSQTVFTDNFSAGFEKWQLLSGSWEPWSIISNEDQQYAQVNILKAFSINKLLVKDQYWHSNWKNYLYELWFEPVTGVDRNISWGFLSNTSYYYLHFVVPYFELVHVLDSQKPIFYTQGYLLTNNKPHYLKLFYYNGVSQVYIDNTLVTEARDPNWGWLGGGKITLEASTGAVYPTLVKFYQAKVSLLGDYRLNVNLQMQTSDLWKNNNYDSDSDWSNETGIGRWGCALTSLTMIMNYYGLNKMPDTGLPVTPHTVNDWLKAQEDGYIGEGMLNWQSAMRLVRLISEQYSTPEKPLPKLEMTWGEANATNYTKVIEQLAYNKPVIGHVPGHFFVIDGYTANMDDLFIKDPFYNYQRLSEHADNIDSLRLLTPSNTDLSYFLLVYPNNLSVNLLDELGNEIVGVVADETIHSPVSNHSNNTQQLLLHYFPKPNNNNYSLVINTNNPENANYKVSFYAYNKQAQPQIFQLEQAFANGNNWQFNFDKTIGVDNLQLLPLDSNEDQDNILYQVCSWQGELVADEFLSSWRQLLKNYLQSNGVHKIYFYRYLDRLACYAQHDKNNNLERYQALLNKVLLEKSNKLSTQALEQLQLSLQNGDNLLF